MALSCGLKAAKIVMTIFNLLFAIGGAAVLGIGIWVVADTSNVTSLTSKSLGPDISNESKEMGDLVKAGAYLLIAVGLISLLTGISGCYGAFTENACALIIYSVLVGAIIITEITGAVLAGVFRNDLETKMKEALRQSMTRNYVGMPTKASQKTVNVVSAAWDWVMVKQECCGVNGIADFTKNHSDFANEWYNNHRNYSVCMPLTEVIEKVKTGWNPSNMSTIMKVPAACCKFTSKDFVKNSDWIAYQDHMKDRNCPLTLSEINTKGCFSALKEEAYKYSVAIIVTGSIVVVIEVVDVIMAIALIVAIRKNV